MDGGGGVTAYLLVADGKSCSFAGDGCLFVEWGREGGGRWI